MATTQNGLPQVNINRPSGAGVSMNTYGQFDVQPKGAILNNSPVIVQTQQAGVINGNPNFGPGQSARVIVNQVNSAAASQINGRVEVAGQRAEVVIANGSGISVNGGGFINTSRAILTTGTPNFTPDGSLAGFDVRGGNISVRGAGLHAGDTAQVDLLTRAILVNAAIYANNLNVVAGANRVDHDTLDATPIAGDGPTPYVSIDISELGGMYANRIVLVGNESDVGVSTKGVLAAQSGDLTLTADGRLVLAGKTSASGNISLSSRDGIDNSGTTYAQQNLTVNTAGTLMNDGVLSAGDDLTAVAATLSNRNGAQLAAGHGLTVTSSGSVSNQGTLGAANAMTVSAADLDNQTGADIHSSSTTVNAVNAITNEGRIEGDAVTLLGASLSNTAIIVGDTVTVNAASIENAGAAAAIAAASAVNLYATGHTANTGGATIFSLGDINIAADGTRDATGQLANRSGTVTNDQSTIEAQGNIEIATQTLTNTRPAPVVETVTTGVDTVHQTKRSRYMACTTQNADKGYCTQAMWSDGYLAPVTSTWSAADIVSQATGPNATDRVLVVNVDGQPQTIYYDTLTTNADGSITANYWDGYDPNVNYDPGSEYPSRNDAHKGYQRVEIARDTTTTVQEDRVAGPQAPQAQIMAGGDITFAHVGTLNNAYSAIGAGGSIQIGHADADSDGHSDGASGDLDGNVGGTLVNNIGRTLYRYQKQDIVSTYAWNENISRDVGLVVQPSIILTPVTIGGTGGTIIANTAVQISATDFNNINAASGGMGGATGGTAGSGAPSFTLPTSGLYTFDTAFDASSLVVTDPRLSSYAHFISSDYLLGQLGLDPSKTIKRLGDGLFEAQMVRNQITQLTGRVYLQGYTSNEDEYRALMTNGVRVAKEFNLEPGLALTAAQMDALTSDIVWLVNQTVTLPDGTTQTVLAPVVYLAHVQANDLQPGGALIAADNVEIHATGSAMNSGVIQGGTQTVVAAADLVNRGGSIGSGADSGTDGGTTVVSATHDVVNASGSITGNRVAVLAGHDIVNTTLVDSVGVSSEAGHSKVSQSVVGAQGTIASQGDLVVVAGNDLAVHGARIAAAGDAQIVAGRDVTVDAVQTNTSQSVTNNSKHHWDASSTINQTSAITAGGSLAMQSANDTTFKGALVSAGGDLAVVAGGNLTATTVTDTATYNNVATDDKTRKQADHSYDERAIGANMSAGGSVTLAVSSADPAKGNVSLTGSSLAAASGAATIAATGSVNIGEGREQHDSYSATESKRGSFVHGSTTDAMQSNQANIGVGSIVSGDSVAITAGNDLTVKGSTIAGTHDVNLAATGNVTITTSQDTQRTSSYYQKRESGLGTGGGIGISVGSRTQTDTANTIQMTNAGSTVGSLDGSLNITAGQDLHVTGSNLVAAQNVTGTGANVIIDAAVDTLHDDETHAVRQSGFTLAIKAPVIDAVSNTVNQARAASRSEDGRAAALHGMAAASGAIDSAGAAHATLNALANGEKPEAKVELSYGSSHSNSTYTEDSTTHRGSSVTAGGIAALVATGGAGNAAMPGSGNLTIAGSNVNANDVILAARDQIDLVNTTDSDTTRSTNQSGGVSVGVSYGTQGFGVDASMSKARGDGNSDAALQNNTHVTAANTATILSGGDTNIIGSNVTGRQVNADIGGNLNISSVQDTLSSAAHQESSGGGFAISQGGGSASYSHTHANADGSYAGVNEQAGIQAGDEGFTINVKGNTGLNGAVIASDADASKNTLTTGTLTSSDLQNQSDYHAHSGGFSAGATTGDGGANTSTHGSTSGRNVGGGAPMLSQNDSGSDSAITRSGVSAGTIVVTDAANQTLDVAALNRDTSNTNGTVASLPDVNTLLDRQADMMAAASAAGEAVSRRIGDYADDRARETGDLRWAEGGGYRAAMQAAGAALVTGLGGGNAIGGAAGAGIASIAAGKLNELSGAIAGSDPTGNLDINQVLGNIVANAIATGAGAVVGGDAGGFAGYNVDRFNRQLHPDEKQAIKSLANGDVDKEHRLEAAGCAVVHCAAEYVPGTADYAKYSALEKEGAAYTVEQAQLKGYSGSYFSTASYGGAVRETPGSTMFRYSFEDAQADQRSWAAGMAAQRPGSIDYVTVGASALGVAGSMTVNLRNGNTYVGGSQSVPVTTFSASVIAGVIPSNVDIKSSAGKAANTDNLIAGSAWSGGACGFGVCLGASHAIGGDTSFEIGMGFGGVTKSMNPTGYAGVGYNQYIFSIPGMRAAK